MHISATSQLPLGVLREGEARPRIMNNLEESNIEFNLCNEYIMPCSESQKKAMKNYRLRNKDKCTDMIYKWRETNYDTFKDKQYEYVKAFRIRQRAKKEFMILCNMDLFPCPTNGTPQPVASP
jgi:hypothetical protein